MTHHLISCILVPIIVCWACASPELPSTSLPSPSGSDPDPYSFCGVSNFAWSDHGRAARSSQPSESSLSCLHSAGLAAIVNLRSEDSSYDEQAAVEATGMVYTRIPLVDDTAPSPEQVTEFLAFVQTQNHAQRAVLTHCAAGRGRAGTMEGIYLLWTGWTTADVFERYIHFGAKIDCNNGGKGQIQALHEIGELLGQGDAWPQGPDHYGNQWQDCARPDYMAAWDYGTVHFPHIAQVFVPTVTLSGSGGK